MATNVIHGTLTFVTCVVWREMGMAWSSPATFLVNSLCRHVSVPAVAVITAVLVVALIITATHVLSAAHTQRVSSTDQHHTVCSKALAAQQLLATADGRGRGRELAVEVAREVQRDALSPSMCAAAHPTLGNLFTLTGDSLRQPTL